MYNSDVTYIPVYLFRIKNRSFVFLPLLKSRQCLSRIISSRPIPFLKRCLMEIIHVLRSSRLPNA